MMIIVVCLFVVYYRLYLVGGGWFGFGLVIVIATLVRAQCLLMDVAIDYFERFHIRIKQIVGVCLVSLINVCLTIPIFNTLRCFDYLRNFM